MFLKRINVKLTIVLVATFLLGASVLYALTVFSLVRSLQQEDHNALRAHLLRYWARYEVGGVQAVTRQAESERFLPGDSLRLIRITDSDNVTRMFRASDEFAPVERELGAGERPHGLDDIAVIQTDEHPVAIEVAALRLGNGVVLQAGAGTENRMRLLGVVSRNFAVSAVLIVIVSALAGVVLTARMLRPLERLNSAVRSIIGTGKISERIETQGGGDELDALTVAFNEMLQRIETLVQGIKGTLDIVAHDLRTPLTRLRGIAEVALRGPAEPERYREALSDCLEESEQIIRMLNAIMDISEVESGVLTLDRRPNDLGSLVEDVIELYRYPAEERSIVIGFSVPPSGIQVTVDTARMRQVVGNLLDNAVKYSPAGGTVQVRVGDAGELAAEYGDQVFIEVVDDGIGIPETELPHIWERLYRGSTVGETSGLGLGLSLVQAIVAAHGGTVTAESRTQKGSRFLVLLPHSTA